MMTPIVNKHSPPWAKVLYCALLVCLLCHYTTAQTISLEGNIGCAVLPPGPPSSLKAHSGYEKVRLRWNAPKNNACVDEYVVDVIHLSDNRHAIFDWKKHLNTRQHSLDIEGLQNGEDYKFTVRAISHRFDLEGEAAIIASPKRFCQKKRPGKVTNLHATPHDGFVRVCWDGVDNDACVSEYKVRTRIHTDYYRHHYDHPEQISKGGCIVIDDLKNNMNYEFSVMAYGKHTGNGIPTYVLASPTRYQRPKPFFYIPDYVDGDYYSQKPQYIDEYDKPHDDPLYQNPEPLIEKWKCNSIPNSYPDCEASRKKLCLPMSCKDQAKVGNCDAPFMRYIDYDTKTITQFCGDYCPCLEHPLDDNGSRFLFLDDYCCRKTNLNYKIKDIIT